MAGSFKWIDRITDPSRPVGKWEGRIYLVLGLLVVAFIALLPILFLLAAALGSGGAEITN